MLKFSFIIACLALVCTGSFAQDNFKKAIRLDGKDNYLEAPHNDCLNFNKAFTIELRFKMKSEKQATLVNKWAMDLTGIYPKGWFIDVFRGDTIAEYIPFIYDPPSGTYMFGWLRFIASGTQIVNYKLQPLTITYGGMQFDKIDTWNHLVYSFIWT